MIHDLIIVSEALGLAVTGMAILVTAVIGLLVWLAGTDWARRPPAGHEVPPLGDAKRLARRERAPILPP